MEEFYNNIKNNVENLNISKSLIQKDLRSQNEWCNEFKKNPNLSKDLYIKYFEYIFSNNTPIKGIWLEFGVWSGKTINLLSKYTNKIYGFDSFIGFPSDDNRKDWKQIHFNLKGKLPKVNTNVKLVKGWFNETLDNFLKNQKENISVLHIDCDLYSSTKYILTTLKHLLVNGSIIMFDEIINYRGFKDGEFLALYEFCNDNPEYNFKPLYALDKVADYKDIELNTPENNHKKTGLPFKPFYAQKCCFIIEKNSNL